MKRSLKVGVTGLGFSRNMLWNYVSAPETELVILHDLNKVLAKATADEFDVPRWTTSFDDVLASDIGKVYIQDLVEEEA